MIDGFDIFANRTRCESASGTCRRIRRYTPTCGGSYLGFVANSWECDAPRVDEAVEHVAHRLRPDRGDARVCGQLSKGFRQRVGLAAGADSRSAGAGARRTDHRPRPAPDPRIREPHPRARRRAHGHPLDPYPAGGRADLREGRDYQRRPRGGGRCWPRCRQAPRSKTYSCTHRQGRLHRRRDAEDAGGGWRHGRTSVGTAMNEKSSDIAGKELHSLLRLAGRLRRADRLPAARRLVLLQPAAAASTSCCNSTRDFATPRRWSSSISTSSSSRRCCTICRWCWSSWCR